MQLQQTTMFEEWGAGRGARRLPVVGEQKDINYYGSSARQILNGPETTGMGFWSINPYVGCAFGCTYCYARYAHRYVLERSVAANPEHESLRTAKETMPPWLAFERRIFVKQNAAVVLRETLRHGSERHLALIRGEAMVIGTATDPYQPAERRFRITRSMLEVLAEHANLKVVIITKSPLITRDVDLLTRIARQSELTIHLSLITLDRELARRIEPRAPTPESRVRALRRLRSAGIAVGINVMPVLPGITDEPAAVEHLVRTVADAGASSLSACALRLRSTAKQRYLPFVASEFPALAARYRASYAHGHQVSERYRQGLRRHFVELCAKYGLPFGHDDQREEDAVRERWGGEDDAGQLDFWEGGR